MKFKNTILFVLLLFTAKFVAGQSIIQKLYSSNFTQELFNVSELNNKDIIHSRTISVAGTNQYRVIVMRSDSSLQTKWEKEFLAPGSYISGSKIIEYTNDSLIMLGSVQDYPQYYFYSLLVKMDSAGNISHSAIIRSNAKVFINGVLRNKDNNLIVYGKLQYTYWEDERMFIAALDGNLHTLWSKEYSFPPSSEIYNLKQYTDNGFIAQAEYNNYYDTIPIDPLFNILLMRLDSLGNLIWAHRVGNTIPNYPVINASAFVGYGDMVVEPDGTIINGVTSSWFSVPIYPDILLQRVDSSGNVLQTMRYGNANSQGLQIDNIIQRSNGDFVLRINRNRFLEIENNLNIFSYSAKYPLPLVGIIRSCRKLINGGFAFLGLINNQNKKSMLALTDSSLNFGCKQSTQLPLPQQPVNFPNTDRTSLIVQGTALIYDSVITVQSFTSNLLMDSLVCNTATAMEEKNEQEMLTVFPTITQHHLTIRKNTQTSILQYKIFNLQGTQLELQPLTSNEIDVSKLVSGFYMLKLFNLERSYTFKFIKQ
jgi:hypothetical protein